MKKYSKIIFVLLLLAGLAGLLLRSPQAGQGVKDGLTLSFRAVLPALFPAMVLCGMIGELAECLPLPPAATLWLTSHLCGFPLGVRTLMRGYRRGLISRSQAICLSVCCSNASPAFLIVYAGETILKDCKVGLLLLAGQLLISLFLAVLLGAFREKWVVPTTDRPLLPIATGSIAAAAQGALTLTGYITLFSVIASLFDDLPGFDFFYGFLEISGGLAALPTGPLQLFLVAAQVGFSGWSVMLQNGSFLLEEHLPLWPMLLGKCLYMLCLPPFVLASLQSTYFLPFLSALFVISIIFLTNQKKGVIMLKKVNGENIS